MLDRLYSIFPSPTRSRPDEAELAIAQAVVKRFDPHLTLEPGTFALRNECRFSYRKRPRSRHRKWNDYCERTLRYDAGDVFVAVGRAVPERLEPFFQHVDCKYPDLMTILKTAVPVHALRR
jgi:hypothetical protein